MAINEGAHAHTHKSGTRNSAEEINYAERSGAATIVPGRPMKKGEQEETEGVGLHKSKPWRPIRSWLRVPEERGSGEKTRERLEDAALWAALYLPLRPLADSV